MFLKLYEILTFFATPFINNYLRKRLNAGKEDAIRFKERMGEASLPRQPGNLVWIHAASVGESLSVIPMIKKLNELYPDLKILMTTGTVSSANIIGSRLPENAIHQYIPIDSISYVKKFLNHWKPNLALWVESELWPNLVCQTSKICPIVLINGRMSDSSFRKWLRYKFISSYILSRFSLVLPQSKVDVERFEKLGARNIKYIGNIKFDAPPLPSDPKKMGELVNMVGERLVWLAASTHEGEEAIIGNVHKKLKETHPEILTIIVPRHPDRAGSISDLLKINDLIISKRSSNDKIENNTDIYIADTMGELGIFYRLVPIVFIGGSLVPHGGQNPIEAARLDNAIICGPHMFNFFEVRREMEDAGAIICIKNQDELFTTLESIISDNSYQKDLATKAKDVVDKQNGIIDLYIEELKKLLSKFMNKE